MVEGKDVADRVVYYFRNFYRVGDISVNKKTPERVDYGDFSFVINIDNDNRTLEVLLIPPVGREDDLKSYLLAFGKSGFYKNERKKMHRHRKRIQGGKFEVSNTEEDRAYHYKARLSPIMDPLMYLDQLTVGVIDCVIRPVMMFGRQRRKE